MPEIVQVGGGMSRIDAGISHVTEHEISQRRARIGAVEAKGPARRSSLLESNVAAGDLGAKLQIVLAELPGEDVVELPDLVGAVARTNLALQIVHLKSSIGAIDVNRRRAKLGR